MSVVLSKHLPLLATAPDGIQKLRGLILELAVRGKLVPQDPQDEPASELLTRIAQERARLEAEGTCKKSKATPPVGEEEQPFALPEGWEWTRLGTVSRNVQYGYTASADHASKDVLFLRITDIQDDCVAWDSVPGCQIPEADVSAYQLQRGDIVIARTGGTIGKSYLVEGLDRRAIFASYLIRVGYLNGTNARYTKVFLGSECYWSQLYANSMGTGQPNVNGTALSGVTFPLPPLAEQQRIVVKVDELMALCDRLEAEQADAEAAHAKLVETLLGTLTQSTDAADLATNWQRLAEHFDTLFTTESSLDALKQTILQLGLSGRLTDVKSFVPLTLGDLLIDACYGTSQKCNSTRVDGAYPVLRIPNVVEEKLALTDLKFSVLEEKELQKVSLLEGDLLVVRTNGSAELVGRCAVVKGLPENTAFASYMIRLRFDPLHVSPEFTQRTLRNHRLQNRMIDFARTTAGQYNVSIGRLRELEMQIPPLAEQHRIVSKIDELMALCDRLKADLAESRRRQERLATTLIESALEAA